MLPPTLQFTCSMQIDVSAGNLCMVSLVCSSSDYTCTHSCRSNDKSPPLRLTSVSVEDLLVSGRLVHQSALPPLLCPADDAKHASSQRKAQGSHRPSDSDTRCPLCPGRRVVPTARPCGHVLCWNCVVSWCQWKEECPVCRRSAKLQELVPLAHTPY
jgi:hypothetical protein